MFFSADEVAGLFSPWKGNGERRPAVLNVIHMNLDILQINTNVIDCFPPTSSNSRHQSQPELTAENLKNCVNFLAVCELTQ